MHEADKVSRGSGPELTIDIGRVDADDTRTNPVSPHVMDHNSKLGQIPNVSFPPVTSCVRGVPCGTTSGCYALNSWNRYAKSVRPLWRANYQLAKNDPAKFFSMIDEYMQYRYSRPRRLPPKYFRWHVSGDIPDQNYVEGMKAIARKWPKTKFMAFTKQYNLNYSNLPANMVIVLSMWPGYKAPVRNTTLPRSWVYDKHDIDTRIPGRAFKCPGECEPCGYCWGRIKSSGVDVVFTKH